MSKVYENLEKIVNQIRKVTDFKPEIAIWAGCSGLCL